jgi:hypothetical protein
MDKAARKQAQRDYLDRKPSIGIFALRCAASGEVWVGGTKSLDKRQNSIWFQLNNRGLADADIEVAWKKHGEASFSYEVLEQLTEDNPHTLQTLLPERVAHWRKELGAGAISIL